MSNARIILVVSIMALQPGYAVSQSQGRIVDYTLADGLESLSADAAVQDRYGFIWISHRDGISRFDGYRFKYYRHNPENPLMQLGPQSLGRLYLDEQGEVWINNATPTSNGYLLKYDYAWDAFRKYELGMNAHVRSLAFAASDSTLWLGTTGQGVIEFNLSTKRVTKYVNESVNEKLSQSANYVYSIHYKGDSLYLFTRFGIWKFEIGNKSFARPRLSSSDTSLLYNASIFQSNFRKDNLFHVDNGMNDVYAVMVDSHYRIKNKFQLPREFTEDNRSQYGLCERDNDWNLWFLNEKGLNCFDPKKQSVIRYGENFGWSNQVLIDRDDNVWMFGWDLGTKKFVKQELKYQETEFSNASGTGIVVTGTAGIIENEFSIVAGGNQQFDANLWISNINDQHPIVTPLNVSLQNGLGGNFSRVSVGQQHVWIGSWFGGVYGFPYDRESGVMRKDGVITFIHRENNPYTLPSNAAMIAVEDSKRQVLWVGSGEGLNKIDLTIGYGSEGSVQRFGHNSTDPNSISKGGVNAIEVEEDGSLWVGTNSGLGHFSDGQFVHVLKNQSIYNIRRLRNGEMLVVGNKLFSIARKKQIEVTIKLDHEASNVVEDLDGNLWMLSKLGLSRYDSHSKSRIDFSNEFGTGLSGLVISAKGIIQMSKSPNKLITLDPLSFNISRTEVNPCLTNLLINNVQPSIKNTNSPNGTPYVIPASVFVLDELVLDYLHNNFRLEFSAMEMTSPEMNRYRHKLEGYEVDWIETDHKGRTVTYTNLDPGTYTFRVRASNHHGVWSDNERALKVVILPPPWRTWWAYTGYWMLGAGLLVVARRIVVQRERLKANLKLEHVELEKAKEVDRVKTSFFTNISHEFRTPLTLIKGPVEKLLEEFGDNPKVQERLKLVQRNSDLLLKLINQLLDLAKLESGSLKVEKSEGDLNSFIRACASSFESLARQKNVALQVDVLTAGHRALFDKDKLETILINLINNAIKFTPTSGKVAVIAALTPSPPGEGRLPAVALAKAGGEAQNSDHLTLSVQDTGIGIPSDQQSKIFERFHQVSESHKEVGTGIGLALVKELVTLMGGTITLKSEVGRGSEFTIQLPVEMASGYPPSRDASDGQGGAESTITTAQRTTRIQHPVSIVSMFEKCIGLCEL